MTSIRSINAKKNHLSEIKYWRQMVVLIKAGGETPTHLVSILTSSLLWKPSVGGGRLNLLIIPSATTTVGRVSDVVEGVDLFSVLGSAPKRRDPIIN